MSGCVFCGILAGELPSSMVYQDEVCSAFVDIQPVNPGHTLIVPNCHAADLAELDPETGGRLFGVAQRVASALRSAALQGSGLRCEGVDLFLADGEAAGQDVFHVHLHVIPRFRGDGFGFRFGPAYGTRPARAELDSVAGTIRETLAGRSFAFCEGKRVGRMGGGTEG
jgi:histidine triad (HIT) family protein